MLQSRRKIEVTKSRNKNGDTANEFNFESEILFKMLKNYLLPVSSGKK